MKIVGELLNPENEEKLYEILWSIEIYLWKVNKLKTDVDAVYEAFWKSG